MAEERMASNREIDQQPDEHCPDCQGATAGPSTLLRLRVRVAQDDILCGWAREKKATAGPSTPLPLRVRVAQDDKCCGRTDICAVVERESFAAARPFMLAQGTRYSPGTNGLFPHERLACGMVQRRKITKFQARSIPEERWSPLSNNPPEI